MKKIKKDTRSVDQRISETYGEIYETKEQKIVHLFIKIIVATTLKEFYEKGNTISKIQSDWAK